MRLIFPKNDSRSDGNSFNPNRPWLKQGAICHPVTKPLTVIFNESPPYNRPYVPKNVMVVRFENSKNYDLVSSEFLKRK